CSFRFPLRSLRAARPHTPNDEQRGRSGMRYVRIGLMALAVVGLMAAGACDDDTRDKAKETVESAKEKAGEAGARAAAEAFRAALKAHDTAEGSGGVRHGEALR